MREFLLTAVQHFLPFVALGSMCLVWGADLPEHREVVILQMRVVEGEGLVHTAGTRSTRPLTVLICDETGKPVEGASVSFRLPDEGPGGSFRGGLRSEVARTGANGQASIRNVEWNELPGPFQIRVIAARDRTRAGIAVPLYLAGRNEKRAAAASR
jgi:hypothetical protein